MSSDRLIIDFYGDAYGITLKIDNILRVVIMSRLRVFWQESKMVSIMDSIDVFFVGWVLFWFIWMWNITWGWWINGTRFSYIYIKGFTDWSIEGLVTGIRNIINAGDGWFIAGSLGTGLYGGIDVVIIGIENFLRVLMMKRLRALWQESKMVIFLMRVGVFPIA